MLYEQGWGKKLTYCIAYGDHEIKDVTWKYTLDIMQLIPRRTLAGEAALICYLENSSNSLKSGCSDSLIQEFKIRDEYESKERQDTILKSHPRLDWNNLRGRESGSIEWKTARGEMGNH